MASKIRAEIMYLKEKHSRSSKGFRHVAKYFQGMKSSVDELTIVNYVVDDVDLIIHNTTITESNFILRGCNTAIIEH